MNEVKKCIACGQAVLYHLPGGKYCYKHSQIFESLTNEFNARSAAASTGIGYNRIQTWRAFLFQKKQENSDPHLQKVIVVEVSRS